MGNKTKINTILVRKIPASKVENNKDYEVGICISGYDKTKHALIAKVGNRVHDDLDENNSVKVNLTYNEAFANDNTYNTWIYLTVIVQVYDIENDQIIETKKQEYYLDEKTKQFVPFFPNPITAVDGSIQGYWHKNKLVAQVEGPYSDPDCKTFESEVKIGTRYYFRATPKQKLHQSELLAMKWSYRYDDEEITPFSYASESIKGNSNIMSCIFHKQPKEIKVYAFYKSPSDTVSVTFYSDVVMDAAPVTKEENISVDEDKKSLIITEEFLDQFMTRTKHGSINKSAPYNKRIPAYIDYLNLYMEKFGINKNNLRKAHFLGQVAKETKFWSYKEDFIYKKTALPNTFGNFKTSEGLKKAELWGYETNKKSVTEEMQIQVGNYAYGTGSKATEMGNSICPNNKLKDKTQDGYNYRGRGLIQITGKGNYIAFQSWYNKKRKELELDEVDFVKNPDKVFEPKFIVLSAIYFWDQHNLNELADKGIESSHVLAISNVINSGEDNDKKKIRREYVQAAYEELGSSDEVNQYSIYIDEFIFKKDTTSSSKKYQYCLYLGKKKIQTITLEKNSNNLLSFPQNGKNWGRFGTRDKGGDNWIDEKVCAALLGFFHSLPLNGFDGTLYFNDISANDGRDIGHSGHRIGNDIDLRYPGSSNGPSTLWSTAMKKYKNETEFLKVFENILDVASKWKFNKNYAYKKGIKNTTGKATDIHQDHFHLGLR